MSVGSNEATKSKTITRAMLYIIKVGKLEESAIKYTKMLSIGMKDAMIT